MFSSVTVPSDFLRVVGMIVPVVLGFENQRYQGKYFLGFCALLCHEPFLRQRMQKLPS